MNICIVTIDDDAAVNGAAADADATAVCDGRRGMGSNAGDHANDTTGTAVDGDSAATNRHGPFLLLVLLMVLLLPLLLPSLLPLLISQPL